MWLWWKNYHKEPTILILFLNGHWWVDCVDHLHSSHTIYGISINSEIKFTKIKIKRLFEHLPSTFKLPPLKPYNNVNKESP